MTDTENRLREAMRTATSASSDPVEFDQISQRVRRRRHRHTAIAACTLLAIAAATTPVWSGQLGASSPAQPIGTTDPTPSSSKPTGLTGLDPAIVQEPWTAERWQRLPWSATGLPRLLDPVAARITSLAADPIGPALVAVQDREGGPIYLLGEDGRWREQDLVDVKQLKDHEGVQSGNALGIGSLSPDGTRLALPQPQGLIVIDLATNSVRRHQLPGQPQRAGWVPGGRDVLVYSYLEGYPYREDSVLVDAVTGSTRQVPYDAHLTSYAVDGTAVEAHRSGSGVNVGAGAYEELRRFDPDGDMEAAPMPVDLFEDTEAIVAAGTDAVLVMRDVILSSVPRKQDEWPGPTILDIDSGQALAQLPVPGLDTAMYNIVPLGWADENTVLLRFRHRVVAWDYPTGTLRRVTEVGNLGPSTTTVTIATALVDTDG